MQRAASIFLTRLLFLLTGWFPASGHQTSDATTTNGLFASTTERVVIDGNMKLGQFSLAFEDLSIDLPGTPLTITRTYDSRDAKSGDFGLGWSLATSSVKIRKLRPLASDWEQTQVGSGFSLAYTVQATRRKRVIVSFPGGRTETFEAAIRAARPLSPSQLSIQKYTPLSAASYTQANPKPWSCHPFANVESDRLDDLGTLRARLVRCCPEPAVVFGG